jgi:hypothetical protein
MLHLLFSFNFVVGYRKAGEFGLLLTFDNGRYAGVMELGYRLWFASRFTLSM